MSTNFGSDTYCLTDIPLISTQVTDPIVLVTQRLVRRLSVQRGALALINGNPDAGFDLRDLVNAKLTPQFKATAQTTIRNECLKDEQVESASVTISLGATTGTVVVRIEGTCAAGPFALVLTVSQLTVEAIVER